MGGRPKRALGQNFLVDANVRRRIVEEARVGAGETILEIGPGRGALTDGLAAAVREQDGHLVLIEMDDRLAAELDRRFKRDPRVQVLHGDVLALDPREIVRDPGVLKVVGNIPYNITSPILFHLLNRPRPREILLMVQREVAERLLADPGGGTFGALTVGVRTVASVERVLTVPSVAFRPRPRVESVVVRLSPFHPSPLQPEEERRLRVLTRSLFQWRRKQLGKILRDHPELGLGSVEVERATIAAGVRTTDRPETVPPEGFIAMVRALPDRVGLTD